MNHPQHARPLYFGVLAGALLPVLVMAVSVFFSPERDAVPVSLVLIAAFPLSLTISVLAGLPLALVLRSKGRLTAVPLCLAVMFLCGIIMASFDFHMNYWPDASDRMVGWVAWDAVWEGALLGAAFGLLAAAGFCLGAGIGIRSRLPLAD